MDDLMLPDAWRHRITGIIFDSCPADADEDEFLPLYTADQVREYAKQAVEAERERVKEENARCYVAR